MLQKIFILSLLFIFTVSPVHAQEETLPEAGMLPDSPLYAFERIFERVGTFFAFSDEAKAERLVALSEERIAEAEALSEKGNSDAVEGALASYQEHLDQALQQAVEAQMNGRDAQEVLATVAEATLRHQAILADVYTRVPEEAKPAIEQAMQKGMQGHEEALEAVSGEKQAEVREKVEETRQNVEQKLNTIREEGKPIPSIILPVIPQGSSAGDTPEQGQGGNEMSGQSQTSQGASQGQQMSGNRGR